MSHIDPSGKATLTGMMMTVRNVAMLATLATVIASGFAVQLVKGITFPEIWDKLKDWTVIAKAAAVLLVSTAIVFAILAAPLLASVILALIFMLYTAWWTGGLLGNLDGGGMSRDEASEYITTLLIVLIVGPFIARGIKAVKGANGGQPEGGGPKATQNTPKTVSTPRGPAAQSTTPEAQIALQQTQSRAPVYRAGKLGTQHAAEGQFWSFKNPASTPGYTGKMGMPSAGGGEPFITGGHVNPGSPVITRPAPGIGSNLGGSMEAITPPGGVTLDWFYMP